MKLSKRQREQVVELLRCAAELAVTDDYGIFGPARRAATLVWHSRPIERIAESACRAVDPSETAADADEFAARVLEAAARVEEGSWP